MGDFYGTGIEIWAGFGPVAITEKNIGADYEKLLRPFFSSFHGQKKKIKKIVHENMKKLASKVAEPAQIQPKS